MSLVTISTYYDPNEALVARAILEQHGFTVFMHDRHFAMGHGTYFFALGGLRLAVPEPEVQDACELLQHPTPIPRAEGDDIDCCPNCGSDLVLRFPNWLGLIVTACAYLLSSTIMLVLQRRRRCRICAHRWNI